MALGYPVPTEMGVWLWLLCGYFIILAIAWYPKLTVRNNMGAARVGYSIGIRVRKNWYGRVA